MAGWGGAFTLAAARGMPPFGHLLNEKQIGLIHQYVIKQSHDLHERVHANGD